MAEKTGLVKLNFKHPTFFRDYAIVQGITYLSEKLRRIEEEKSNFFFYVMSIIFGTLIGGFFQSGNYNISLILMNILLIIIILEMHKRNKIKVSVVESYHGMEKEAKRCKISLPKFNELN